MAKLYKDGDFICNIRIINEIPSTKEVIRSNTLDNEELIRGKKHPGQLEFELIEFYGILNMNANYAIQMDNGISHNIIISRLSGTQCIASIIK